MINSNDEKINVQEILNDLNKVLGKIQKLNIENEKEIENVPQIIKLNIGGKIFTTTLSTLTTEKDTFFTSMFSEQFNTKPDKNGEYFIDRNPKHFHLILDYLRNPTKEVNLRELTTVQEEEFYDEVDFYSIESLKRNSTKIRDFENWETFKI
jgi:hypothetical protein